jgi:hypothetical protein
MDVQKTAGFGLLLLGEKRRFRFWLRGEKLLTAIIRYGLVIAARPYSGDVVGFLVSPQAYHEE